MNNVYRIWCFERNMWWKDGRMGYTESIDEAGLYSADEARDIVQTANVVKVEEMAVEYSVSTNTMEPEPTGAVFTIADHIK